MSFVIRAAMMRRVCLFMPACLFLLNPKTINLRRSNSYWILGCPALFFWGVGACVISRPGLVHQVSANHRKQSVDRHQLVQYTCLLAFQIVRFVFCRRASKLQR